MTNLFFLSVCGTDYKSAPAGGALHFGSRLMIIETQAALKLIDRYFQ
jgi:hypothetical protein